ncbi:Putative bifunctional amine oxidase DDB_G0291301 Includes: RecName: Full=Putative sarcosine oxidase; Short=PSO; Includes: RecName: Full=Putative L-amino-acid oxidase [Serendipita indica DSM 11827]|uniref:Amine oxidase domain-containing protein n=1 Tax=Serendipita indica (strain DSM 11827) TaxID=1109443 RepID=G4TAF0_SERID|nr:Putative bifunctional amine oxidase DDB_G0291301 Includes: RecName: Full=Putative sarcosine oxidase; Short=PSO; Includes: RecName: Full=Putative L-amino-acid oxidase [Serendipita indica DSM 11827]CCA68289.1 hypothetical protein PIIN_02153 [Serendipita indica DSM 11827]
MDRIDDISEQLHNTWRIQYARQLIENSQAAWHKGHGYPPSAMKAAAPAEKVRRPIKIGILGAGAAGMYAAMIIDSLKSPDFTYEILEANPERVGGRLYTHHFSDGPNDYFDVGAMRYPYIPFMYHTFYLLEHDLGMTEAEDPMNPREGELIKYFMSIDKNLNRYNGKTLTNEQVKNGGPDPFDTGLLDETVEQLLNNKFSGMKEQLANNFQDEWNKLVGLYDALSMRTFLATSSPAYSQKLITTIETFDSGTTFYDSAMLEMLMESMDFEWPVPPGEEVKWYCVQGGSGVIAERMKAKVKNIEMGKEVTKISANLVSGHHEWESVDVEVNHDPTSKRRYDHVISTMPFGCFRNIDTSECHLTWDLEVAIRCLKYSNSTKVGMKFKSRWWEKHGQRGGVSKTDGPTRCIVYPSYGIDGEDATMIVSYTWAQDATRLGSLCRGKGTPAEETLVDILLDDLAVIHGIKIEDLRAEFVDYFPWNWDDNPYSAGAFALFGPGQFSTLYPEVTQPMGGRLHFAGEATSVHHAWVVGALNSALRTIIEILLVEDRWEEFKPLLKERIKYDDEIDIRNIDILEEQIRIGRQKGKITQKRIDMLNVTS